MLNTFQMRSARHVQTFAVKVSAANRAEAILVGARAEIDAQKTAAAGTVKTGGGSKEKGKGRARGTPATITRTSAGSLPPSSLTFPILPALSALSDMGSAGTRTTPG